MASYINRTFWNYFRCLFIHTNGEIAAAEMPPWLMLQTRWDVWLKKLKLKILIQVCSMWARPSFVQRDVDAYSYFLAQTPKRCSSASPGLAPLAKSPRTDSPPPTAQTSDSGRTDGTDAGVSEGSVSPAALKKSWRRSTITRRSLPALPNPYQGEMHILLL